MNSMTYTLGGNWILQAHSWPIGAVPSLYTRAIHFGTIWRVEETKDAAEWITRLDSSNQRDHRMGFWAEKRDISGACMGR